MCYAVDSAACLGHLDRLHAVSVNRLRQQGHSPSNPRANAENAVGCGRVMIALNARGSPVRVVPVRSTTD
jgi:hypothetical protein